MVQANVLPPPLVEIGNVKCSQGQGALGQYEQFAQYVIFLCCLIDLKKYCAKNNSHIKSTLKSFYLSPKWMDWISAYLWNSLDIIIEVVTVDPVAVTDCYSWKGQLLRVFVRNLGQGVVFVILDDGRANPHPSQDEANQEENKPVDA